MKASKYTCDRCGEIGESKRDYHSPDGWNTIYYKLKCKGSVYDRSTPTEYHLCQECSNELNIPAFKEEQNEVFVGEQLINIIYEIANGGQNEINH